MQTHADKTEENKSTSLPNKVSQKQDSIKSAFQFVDNRPEVVAQRKLQKMANSSLASMSLRVSVPSPLAAEVPIQLKAKPGNNKIRAALAEAITSESGSCDQAMREVFGLLGPHVDNIGQLGSVVLWWTETYDEEAQAGADALPFEAEGHTAVLVQWDEGTFVVDASMSQFGGPDLFVGSEADWRVEVERCATASAANKSAGITEVQYVSMPQVILFKSGNNFQFALLAYFNSTPAGITEFEAYEARQEENAYKNDIWNQWENSSVIL